MKTKNALGVGAVAGSFVTAVGFVAAPYLQEPKEVMGYRVVDRANLPEGTDWEIRKDGIREFLVPLSERENIELSSVRFVHSTHPGWLRYGKKYSGSRRREQKLRL